MLKAYANFNGWSKHCGVGIFTMMKLLKEFKFVGDDEDACICKKLSGSAKTYFLIHYVEDILLIGNNVSFINTY